MKKVIILAVVILAVMIFALLNQLRSVGMLEEAAFAITDDLVTKNLKSDNVESVQGEIELHSFNALEDVYERLGNIYIGEEKVLLNGSYPLYVNDSAAVFNINSNSKLITADFDSKSSYYGLYVSNGTSFNANKQQADLDEYILIGLSNGTYMNVQEMAVNANSQTATVALNSIVVFSEGYLAYYEPNDGVLKYNRVTGLNENSWIKLGDHVHNYFDFLKKLGIIKEEIVPTPEPTQIVTEQPTPLPTPKPTEKEVLETPQAPVPPSDQAPPPKVPDYVKPQVSCEPLTADVYSLDTTVTIFDPVARITKGVRFEVYRDGTELFLRKAAVATGPVSITPLPPDTTYKVVCLYSYYDEYDMLQEERLFEQTIKTRPLSELEPMELGFDNSDVFYNKIQVKDLSFAGTPELLGSKTIPHVRKINAVIGSVTYGLEQEKLSKMKNGEKVVYDSPTALDSSSRHSYEFICLDRFGNVLPMTKEAKGETITCKMPPQARVSVVDRTLIESNISITINNEENTQMDNCKVMIFDEITGNQVPFRADSGSGASGAVMEYGIPTAGATLKLLDLPVKTALRIRVYADYDIEDNNGMQYAREIGSVRLVTADIASLGRVFLKTTQDTINDKEAGFKIALDTVQTNDVLELLITSIKIEAVNPQTGSVEAELVLEGEEELEDFRKGGVWDTLFTNLSSMTEYSLVASAQASYVDVVYSVGTYNNLSSFKTYRSEPVVEYGGHTATASLIELYDVQINDPDGAVIGGKVALTVSDSVGRIVDSRSLQTNTPYDVLSFTQLSVGETYSFAFTALEYNNAYSLTTYKRMHVLQPVLSLVTEDGISGKVSLRGLTYEPSGQASSNRMKATMRVELRDNLTQLTPPTGKAEYYVKILRGGELRETLVRPIGTRPLDEIFDIVVDRYHDYTVELWVYLNGRDLLLDQTEFESDEPIIGLSTMADFAQIGSNPTGKFVVLNDVSFTAGPWNTGTQFQGVLDFQGYKATFATNNYMIYNMGRNGVVKNIVADIWVTHTDAISYRGYIVQLNYGTIQNVIVNLKGCTEYMHFDTGLICRINYALGTIENFVINLEQPMYVRTNFGAVVYYNYGTVRNGYVYGASYNYAPEAVTDRGDIILAGLNAGMAYSVTNIGGIVGYNNSSGWIENVYSLANIKIVDNTSTGASVSRDRIGAVCGRNDGYLKNAYAVGEVRYEQLALPYRDFTVGPSVGSHGDRLQTENNYYVSMYSHTEGDLGYNYTSSINLKATRNTLRDAYWQQKLLGSAFNTNVVSSGVFPTVNMPKSMPRQNYISLPALTASAIELASVVIEEQYEDYAVAVFTFKNPQALMIKGITLQNLSATVIAGTQFDADDMSRVRVRLYNPTMFLSAYTVINFTTQELGTGVTDVVSALNAPKCEAAFYKPIRTIADWKNINNSRAENYRLKADLDFAGSAASAFQLTGTISGKIDGGIYEVTDNKMVLTGLHKITNLKLTTSSYVIGTLSGGVSNLRVENFDISFGNSTNTGFIASTSAGADIDNVHLDGVRITASSTTTAPTTVHNTGALVGNLNTADIRNCSVNNAVIKDFAHPNARVGGIAGYGNNSRLLNCYVYNIAIELTAAQGAQGTGALVGSFNNSIVSNAYAVGTIDTIDQNTGGLIGYLTGSTKLLRTWADVDITSTVDRIGGLVGFDTATSNTYDSLVIGDISSTVIGSGYIHRAAGSVDPISNTYAWEGQRVNGQIPKDEAGNILPDDTTLATEADLCDERYYTRQIRMGAAFNYSKVKDLEMPLLYHTNGNTLLPYQTPHHPSAPEIELESLTANLVGTTYMVQVVFKHDDDVEINNILADSLSFVPLSISKLSPERTIYEGRVDVNAVERYWDAYQMTGVVYNGGLTKRLFAQVDFGVPLYRRIDNINDWLQAMRVEGRAETYENFMLMGDIDFAGITAADADVYNVKINRLIGGGLAGTGKRTIRNIDLNLTPAAQLGKCFINTINSDIRNVGFENVNLSFSITNDYCGIIGRHFGSVVNVGFKNITLVGGRNYVGSFAFIRGDIDGVTVENFRRVLAAGDNIGAFAGRVQDGSIKNVQILGQSGGEVIVNGSSYVGGMVGYAVNTDSSFCSADYVKIRGLGNYVGGLIGYSTAVQTGSSIVNEGLSVRNSWIRGGNAAYTSGSYTGGIFGRGTSLSKYAQGIYSVSENNTIIGYNHVGGVSGYHQSWYAWGLEAKNCNVFGARYVGGVHGQGGSIERAYVSDSVISTIYDPSSASAVSDGSLPVAIVPSDANVSIGGVVGVNAARYSGVARSTVGAEGASHVGGVIGTQAENSYSLYSIDNEVFGARNIGGIVGNIERQTLYISYSNSNVTASDICAGGIAGYILGNRVLHGTDLGRVRGCYTVGGVIKAADYAGGIFGYAATQHDNTTYKNRVLLSAPALVETTSGINADFFGYLNDGTRPVRGRVFQYSQLIKAGDAPVYPSLAQYPLDDFLTKTTAIYEELRTVTPWHLSTRVDRVGGTPLTHNLYDNRLADVMSNTYFTVTSDQTAGFMPKLRYSHNTSAVPLQGQKDIPIPAGEFEPLMADDMMRAFHSSGEPQVLPVPQFYASGADKLNIEFDSANQLTYFAVYSEDQMLLRQEIGSRVYTLTYDFATPLTIKVGDGVSEEAVYIVSPKDVSSSVMTWGNDYYYLTSRGIQSGKAGLLAGSFVNLAGGEALSTSGAVYRLAEGAQIRTVSGISLNDSASPLYTFAYDGYTIKTYKNYSTSETPGGAVLREFRLLVKNAALSVLDPNTPMLFDGLIADAAGEEQYLTVLGSNGILVNLMHPIKLPDGFKNDSITEMSNNLNSTTPYVLVRYSDGSVVVFNYLSGTVQSEDMVVSDMSLLEYAQDYVANKTNMLMRDASDGYIKFAELKDKLIIQSAPDEVGEGVKAEGDKKKDGTGTDKKSGGSPDAAQAESTSGPGKGNNNGAPLSGNAAESDSSGGEKTNGESNAGGLEKPKTSDLLPVYDVESGEYVVYDKTAMLGVREGDTHGEDGMAVVDEKKPVDDEAPKPLNVIVSPEKATQAKTFFEDGGMIVVIILIAAVAMLMLFIFDRRKRLYSNDKK